VVFSPSQVDLRRMRVGTLTSTTRRFERKRRDSNCHVRSASNEFEDEENVHNSRKSVSRPPITTTSSHWHNARRYVPPQASSPQTSLLTPRPGDMTSRPFNLQPLNRARGMEIKLQIPDASSAGETSFSPPSSDADVDSHTDESSPEPDAADDFIPGLGLYYSNPNRDLSRGAEINFFSASQPVTPSTDHVLATTPASTRTNLGLGLSMSIMTPNAGSKTRGFNSVTAPSSPEMKYKLLFHGPVVEKPGDSLK